MITPGTRLGPYEIVAPLGAGGMGEVYRARDSRLDRTVAIKILPPHLSSDARFRERFEREAKAISALSHPHICTLFDVGSHDGTEFLVMEYLEGESLADRLEKGPLPIDQVIRYGAEIAGALERAHRAGIVHRDLKPGNVILTKGGAKLLDFGLAKYSPLTSNSTPHDATLAMAASRQKPLTEEGSILGTFQYMAPEQIEGRDADERSDIFALGAVLYEMATGRRAFEAKSRASLIASILDREPPPISTIQPLTPPAFERVVRMCLEKDPDERWQSAHDVAAELKWIATASGEATAPALTRRSRRAWLRTIAALMAGLLTGAIATWLALRTDRPIQAVARTTVRTPAAAPLLVDYGTLAISPDGRHVVYRARVGNRVQLFLRSLDRPDATPIAGTEDGHSPSFSPDGRWIAFSANQAINKVPREGGTRTRLAASPGGGLGLTWAGENIYATRAFASGIWEVPASGGTPRQVVKTNDQQRAVVWPDALPDGKTILATVWNKGAWDDASIIAVSVADGKQKVLVRGGYAGRYAPSGHLLFMRGGNLLAVPFDARTLEAGSNPVAVLNGVAFGTSDGEGHYAISSAGHLLYLAGGNSEPGASLIWIDPAGRRTPVVPTRRSYGSVALTPDNRGAMVTIESSTFDIWHLDFDRDSLTRVSYGGDDADAVLTPDGNRVIWSSSRSGNYNLFWRAADNSTAEERLLDSPNYQELPSITPDGRTIVFSQAEAGKQRNVMALPLDTRKPQALIATEFDEMAPVVSPDGAWLAYVSNESGRDEVYVTSYPTPAGKWQVSTDGGIAPRWMPNGRAIVYLNGKNLTVVPVEISPRVRAGKPRVLASDNFDDEYSVAPDGRIAAIVKEETKTADQINLVLNWTEELKRRVPR